MAPSGITLNPSRQPTLGNRSLVSPEQEKSIRDTNITFSFRYFRQIDQFGIGNSHQSWHIGLIERLTTLATMTPKEVLEENRGSSALRCHEIDWSLKNVPINRCDLYWLPKCILDNEDSFPIMQFAITISTGRIVGFFGKEKESSVFYIVLLDPNHNIQPTKKYNYQIRPTTKGISQYDELFGKLENIKSIVSKCKETSCVLNNHIDHIDSLHENIVYFCLDPDFYEEYIKVSKNYSGKEIMENGILVLMPAK